MSLSAESQPAPDYASSVILEMAVQEECSGGNSCCCTISESVSQPIRGGAGESRMPEWKCAVPGMGNEFRSSELTGCQFVASVSLPTFVRRQETPDPR